MKTSKSRRPWNRVEQQVYSISTLDKFGKVNMNIATYVVPINMQPKRYVLAVYRNTKTHENIFKNKKQKHILIQALSEGQFGFVKTLGKKSGLKYDKEKFLEKQELNTFKSLKYLKGSSFTLYCKIEKYILVGDHDLVIVNVEKILENNDKIDLLDTEDLQDKRIIL